jgi:hypothetical protein
MPWADWAKINDRGLAQYVLPDVANAIHLSIRRDEVLAQPGGRRLVAEAIFNALSGLDIRYARPLYNATLELQTIRDPGTILCGSGDGTCLDLALLFAGAALGNELLPLVVVLEGHAVVAISLEFGRRDADALRRTSDDGDWAGTGLLTGPAMLRALTGTGRYLVVECTGFAQSDPLPDVPEGRARTAGRLSFARAIEAGREQLDRADRPLLFAVDPAYLQDIGKMARLDPLGATNSTVITGEMFFELIARASPPLTSHIRTAEFQALVRERTRHFVGRDFAFQAIDKRLENPALPSGYIIVKGEPGIGKTALLSEIVNRRGCVHHFNIASQNIRSTHAFLTNVCAQLIVRYKLNYFGLPAEATDDGGFLSRLLTEAAADLSGRPIVVTVDALDEAEDTGLPPDVNRLYLPPFLPEGVFFIVSTRDQHDFRLSVDRAGDEIYLRDSDPENIADVGAYVLRFLQANREQMAARLKAWGLGEGEFRTIISEKSQGNFMYVVHVVRAIRDGRLDSTTVSDIRKLPDGLRDYYRRHWRVMKAQSLDRFERYYEPVVCMLAAAREPVSLTAIEEWTGLPRLRIQEVIHAWREFFDQTDTVGGEFVYRIYHASFQDFLKEEVGLVGYHDRIQQTALDRIRAIARPSPAL